MLKSDEAKQAYAMGYYCTRGQIDASEGNGHRTPFHGMLDMFIGTPEYRQLAQDYYSKGYNSSERD